MGAIHSFDLEKKTNDTDIDTKYVFNLKYSSKIVWAEGEKIKDKAEKINVDQNLIKSCLNYF